jgi:very-short-patch-repair endonuclease
MDLRRIDEWGTRHHGVITRRVAMSLGLTSSAWYRAIERGHLQPIHPGVARLIGTESTPEQRIHAAVLAAGRSTVASHRSAAVLWGIDRPDHDPVDIIVPRHRTRLQLDGVVVHRPTDRDDMSTSMRSLTPCTNLLRTLIDLGAVVPSVHDVVSSAITSGVVTPSVLEHLLDRHARQGRAGAGPLRQALRSWPIAGKPADSELEVRMARLLRRHRLPPATFHPIIAGFEVDFLVDGSNLVLECDGWDHHGRTKEQFDWHTERDQLLGVEGYVVHHFTWRQITRRSAQTAQRIRQLLATWSPDVLAPSSRL